MMREDFWHMMDSASARETRPKKRRPAAAIVKH